MKPILFISSFLLAAGCFCQSLVIDENHHDFGLIFGAQSVSRRFTISNSGSHTLYVSKLQVSCHCLSAEIENDRILPGRSGYIDVLPDTRGKEGKINQFVSVISNSKNSHFTYIEIKANVNPTARITPQTILIDSADITDNSQIFKKRFSIKNLGLEPLMNIQFNTIGTIESNVYGNRDDPIPGGHLREFDIIIKRPVKLKNDTVNSFINIVAQSGTGRLSKKLDIHIDNSKKNGRGSKKLKNLSKKNDRRSGEVLAKLNSNQIRSGNVFLKNAKNFATSKGCKNMEFISSDLVCLLLNEDESTEAAMTRLKEDNDFIYVQPNYLYKYRAAPDDPCFSNQYSLKNTGQNIPGMATVGTPCLPVTAGIPGTLSPDIQAIYAWDIF